MMRLSLLALFFMLFGYYPAATQTSGFAGGASPYTLQPGNGEPGGSSSVPLPGGFSDATGRVYVSRTLTGTRALIITTWQSNIESAASWTYTTSNATALNFSIYDRALYKCANPVLGAAQNTGGLGSNSANCQIADSLITAGTYANVIMAPVAIGGTFCSDWVPSGASLYQRIVSLMNGLKSAGLTPATGFTGDVWVVPHGGETDAVAGTARATLATCIRAFAQAFTDNGLTNFRFFVPTESMVSNSTSATIQGAQADAVSSGCTTCRAGANVDGLTGGTNRQADGTHLTQTGAANLAALDVTIITNCKNTSC